MTRTAFRTFRFPRCSARSAFSLVELLVVIAVIMLLLSILLPSLEGVRSQARRAKCASNLRQLGLGLQYYAAEQRGFAMPLAYFDQPEPVYWWGRDGNSGIDHTRGFVWDYLRSELRPNGVFECPEQPWGTYTAQGGAESLTSTYGYNGYFLTPGQTPGWASQIGHRPWQNLDTVRDPARLFAFADTGIELDGTLYNNALLDPPLLYKSSGRWTVNASPTTSFRHAGLANAAHTDGHVEAHAPADGRMTSPELRLGSVGRTPAPFYVPDWRDW